MKGDPEERAVQIGRYLVQSGATVRAGRAPAWYNTFRTNIFFKC